MDAYSFSLALGAVGLGVMGISGLGHHLHPGQGHGSAGARGSHHAVAGRGQGTHSVHVGVARVSRAFLTLLSPRVLFSLLLGLGATGVVLRGVVGGLWLAVAAAGGGLLLEMALVRPLWAFAFRFASPPALTLESCVGDPVNVVSGFDAEGQGLVGVELNGQIVQLLGTLSPEDRRLGGRVRTGDRLFITDVDAERHRVIVSRVSQ